MDEKPYFCSFKAGSVSGTRPSACVPEKSGNRTLPYSNRKKSW